MEWILGAMILAIAGCSRTNLNLSEAEMPPPKIDMKLPEFKTQMIKFTSCQDVLDWAREREREIDLEMQKYSDYNQGATPTENSVAAPALSTESYQTNIQEAGIDEPDVLKVDSNFAFHSRGSQVVVIDRNLKKVKQTLIPASAQNIRILKIEERLILLYDVVDENGSFTNSYSNSSLGRTGLSIFEQRSSDWVLTSTQLLPGKFFRARSVEGRLILFSQIAASHKDLPRALVSFQNQFPESCGQTYQPILDDLFSTITFAYDVSFPSGSLNLSAHVLPGRVNEFYASSSGFYFLTSAPQWFSWDSRHLADTLGIQKFNFDNAGLTAQSVAVVPGNIRNSWSVKDFEEGRFLAVATTFNFQGSTANKLFVLDTSQAQMTLHGQSEAFGLHEDLRAVRFVGKSMYAVTFKKTDPLFHFDITDLAHPILISELKVPGFSAYLHPIGENQILGLGYDAIDKGSFAWWQGLKLSIFENHQNEDLREADHKIFGSRGSYTPVVDDHTAFQWMPQERLVSFPTLQTEDSGSESVAGAVISSGLQVVRVAADGSLTPVELVSHRSWISPGCWNQMAKQSIWWQMSLGSWGSSLPKPFQYYDVERLMKDTDGSFWSFSRYGFRRHEPNSLTVLSAEPYDPLIDICGPAAPFPTEM